jgi:hypothetical protein
MFFALVVIGVSATSCTTFCTDELSIETQPQDTTIVVGQQFTVDVDVTTCGGSERVPVDLRWSADDPAVVQVDERTGRVVGLAAGDALVEATDLGRYGARPFLYVHVVLP